MGPTDGGAIVLGWLGRVTLSLGLIGLVAFDLLSLSVSSLGVVDDAEVAARAAARAYGETHNVDRAYEAALAAARDINANDMIAAGTFQVAGDGHVTLTVQREPMTMVARHLPSIKDRLTVRGDGEASP